MSEFQTSATGMAGGLLRAAGSEYEIRRASEKFCPECGSPLSVKTACKACGTEMKAGARFCPECGRKA